MSAERPGSDPEQEERWCGRTDPHDPHVWRLSARMRCPGVAVAGPATAGQDAGAAVEYVRELVASAPLLSPAQELVLRAVFRRPDQVDPERARKVLGR